MRKLLWFTVGFAASAALYTYWLSGIWILLLATICLLFSLILLLTKNARLRISGVVALGLSIGFLYNWGYEDQVLSDLKPYDDATIKASVVATDYPVETQQGYRVNGKIELGQRKYDVCLYYSGHESVKPGDSFTGTVTLRYTPKDGKSPSTYHQGEGQFLIGYAEKEIGLIKCPEVPARYFSAELRHQLSERISHLFPTDTAAFSAALLLGDDTEIDFSDNIAFQKSGIRHVIAVSGLHVSILFSMVYFLTGRRKWLTLLIGLPVLLVFAAVAGFSPSVMRACLMQATVLLAVALNREYDPGSALSFAVLVMLLINPLTIASVSFQLSVGCVAGILLFSGRIRNALMAQGKGWRDRGFALRLKSWFVSSVSVSLSAMSVTLPLCALYFGTVGAVGVLTNLLTLWVVTYIFIGIILACVLSYLWLPLGTAAAYLISWPERYVLWCARLLAQMPFGTLYTESPYTVLWVAAVCVLLIVFLLLKKKPKIIFTVAVASFYFAAAGLSMLEPYFYHFEATVVDVGQGQCVIFQCKNRVYMVDCGSQNGEDAATAALCALGARGIQKLDGLILTHYDEDHCNGAQYLMDCVEVDALYLPVIHSDDPLCVSLCKKGVPVVWVDETQTIPHPTGMITLFPSEKEGNGNESSMCILFQAGSYDILITGDRDQDGERQLVQNESIPDIEVLVAGHHGAKTSTGVTLLNHTKPELVVISAGDHNLYGHPHEEILKRLEQCGCRVRRTDLDGSIKIRG